MALGLPAPTDGTRPTTCHAYRAKLIELTLALDADPGVSQYRGDGPRMGIRWRRVLAGVFLGCVGGTAAV